MNSVYITHTGVCLPNAPVANEDMEAILGQVADKPSRARRIILRRNGIQNRHYAIDRATGLPNMSNAQMTAAAIRELDLTGPVDLLATGTSTPDQLQPNHGVMVHGELGWDTLEVVSTAGICLSGFTAFKYAYLAVKGGEARRAVATGSERVSAHFLAHRFEAECAYAAEQLQTRPELAFEKDFLRWMLSDGAGAWLLEPQPRGALSLKVHWLELFSYAHQLPACMFAGAERNADGSLTGWADIHPEQWGRHSTMSLQQDVRLLNEQVVSATVAQPLTALMAKHGLRPEQVDWFLPHFSSMYFQKPLIEQLDALDFHLPADKWFTNLTRCGNTGSASPFIMLDELFRSGRIKPGHKLLMYVPESGRFSSGFALLEAV